MAKFYSAVFKIIYSFLITICKTLADGYTLQFTLFFPQTLLHQQRRKPEPLPSFCALIGQPWPACCCLSRPPHVQHAEGVEQQPDKQKL